MLIRLQMGVHEEELVWLEKRVKAIKDAYGSGSTTHCTEAEAIPWVMQGDAHATSDSNGCSCATMTDLTKSDMTAD